VNISTAFSSIGGALRSVGTALAPIVQTGLAAAPAFAPLIAQAIAGKQRQAQAYGGYDMGMVPTGFMPGGYTLPSLGGGALAGLGSLAGALGQGLMTADPYGGLRSPIGSSQCITPTVSAQRYVLPRTVNVPNPNNPSMIETYVKAPRVKYRVSVSRAGSRRCCAGGR